MTTNPEQHVLDEINALIDHQLATGWVDNYDADRYPKCNGCRHDWHGARCQFCGTNDSQSARRRAAAQLRHHCSALAEENRTAHRRR